MTDLPGAIRKETARSVGAFNEEFQVKEDTDLIWRMEAAGYKSVRSYEAKVVQIKGEKALTFGSFLRRTFVWGYWYHMLFHIHPQKVGYSGGWPLKFILIVSLGLLAVYYPSLVILFPILLVAWLSFRFYRHRRRVKGCLLNVGTASAIPCIMLFILAFISDAIVSDLGKSVAIIDKLRGRKNPNYR